MTDPTIPVLQPEPAASRRKLSRKWIVAIVVVALLVLGLGSAAYGVHSKGDAKAKDYAKAVDAWNDKRTDLIGAPAFANDSLWDFGDPTTKESLAKQKTACARVLTLRKSAARNAAALPKADGSPLKLLSSKERKAIKASAAREKAVKEYAKGADKVLVQLHRDCVWNIRTNSLRYGESGSERIYAKANQLKLKSGHSEAGYYCPPASKIDCMPVTAAKRARFAELILKALKVDKAFFMKQFFGAGSCDSTSYAELCTALKTNAASYYGNFAKYGTIFKTIDPTSSRIGQEVARMEKSNKAADKAFKVAMFKAHPKFKTDDYRVSRNVFWREAFFFAANLEAIEDLSKLRKAIDELPAV